MDSSEGGAEGPDKREKRGERAMRVEAKRASSFGVGSGGDGGGGTKWREGERVVARRGA